jgi:hypothetical protein
MNPDQLTLRSAVSAKQLRVQKTYRQICDACHGPDSANDDGKFAEITMLSQEVDPFCHAECEGRRMASGSKNNGNNGLGPGMGQYRGQCRYREGLVDKKLKKGRCDSSQLYPINVTLVYLVPSVYSRHILEI